MAGYYERFKRTGEPDQSSLVADTTNTSNNILASRTRPQRPGQRSHVSYSVPRTDTTRGRFDHLSSNTTTSIPDDAGDTFDQDQPRVYPPRSAPVSADFYSNLTRPPGFRQYTRANPEHPDIDDHMTRWGGQNTNNQRSDESRVFNPSATAPRPPWSTNARHDDHDTYAQSGRDTRFSHNLNRRPRDPSPPRSTNPPPRGDSNTYSPDAYHPYSDAKLSSNSPRRTPYHQQEIPYDPEESIWSTVPANPPPRISYHQQSIP